MELKKVNQIIRILIKLNNRNCNYNQKIMKMKINLI